MIRGVHPVLLHQGGWDEILIFLVPTVVVVWLLRRAEKRAKARAAAGDEDGTAPEDQEVP